ncbi:DeoR/GlpR family DNA-binding transcription regulator [Mesorhizobium sp. L-8-3]|uniref:DeoR/GlpR family DNA-binding transcription regulator n=1 Tax=Mesorhizobium sp. L-8-3 TaxID=2744522 RepID=UPI0019273BC6|nr:DeoR/GlpR family DNA-binding transcription regulator [Mesorhizobium sp. L-8-3]BCH25206.1 DeoR family transcriptional regulator [Mesorhizobium sp. L-8-3]
MTNEATPDERREFVLATLSERGRLSTTELSERFGVSEDTARRDFREMAADGLIKRVHGAALPISPAALPFSGRYRIASDLKARLAKAGARLVLPNQVVVMDGGTSNLEVARHLPRDLPATIVTNSPPIATATSEHPMLEVILLGGVFDKRSQMTLGARVLDALRDVNADLCFIGVHGLHAEFGLTTSGYDEATIKQAMMKSAAEVAAVATPDKFGSAAAHKFGDLALVDVLVTEDSARAREWVTAASIPSRIVYC